MPSRLPRRSTALVAAIVLGSVAHAMQQNAQSPSSTAASTRPTGSSMLRRQDQRPPLPAPGLDQHLRHPSTRPPLPVSTAGKGSRSPDLDRAPSRKKQSHGVTPVSPPRSPRCFRSPCPVMRKYWDSTTQENHSSPPPSAAAPADIALVIYSEDSLSEPFTPISDLVPAAGGPTQQSPGGQAVRPQPETKLSRIAKIKCLLRMMTGAEQVHVMSVREFRDKEPDLIREHLTGQLSSATPARRVTLWLSAHGAKKDAGESVDVLLSQDRGQSKDGLHAASDFLQKLFAVFPGQRKLLIVETCYAKIWVSEEARRLKPFQQATIAIGGINTADGSSLDYVLPALVTRVLLDPTRQEDQTVSGFLDALAEAAKHPALYKAQQAHERNKDVGSIHAVDYFVGGAITICTTDRDEPQLEHSGKLLDGAETLAYQSLSRAGTNTKHSLQSCIGPRQSDDNNDKLAAANGLLLGSSFMGDDRSLETLLGVPGVPEAVNIAEPLTGSPLFCALLGGADPNVLGRLLGAGANPVQMCRQDKGARSPTALALEQESFSYWADGRETDGGESMRILLSAQKGEDGFYLTVERAEEELKAEQEASPGGGEQLHGQLMLETYIKILTDAEHDFHRRGLDIKTVFEEQVVRPFNEEVSAYARMPQTRPPPVQRTVRKARRPRSAAAASATHPNNNKQGWSKEKGGGGMIGF